MSNKMTETNAALLRGCQAALAYLADPPSKFEENRAEAVKIIQDAIRQDREMKEDKQGLPENLPSEEAFNAAKKQLPCEVDGNIWSAIEAAEAIDFKQVVDWKVVLCLNTFERLDCKVIDVGYSDRVLTVECKPLLAARDENVRYIQILEELCSSEVLKEAQDRLRGVRR